MAVNFTGLASGLDTRSLIDAILDVQRRPLERLQVRQQTFSQKRAALDELRSKLNGFESALRTLSLDSTFRGRTSSVSDEAVLRATPGSGGETGLFEIEVTNLAETHKVKSARFIADDQGLIADGTLTIQSGNNDPITVEVNAASGNNTLGAVRDAINAADAGVQASVIFDGTDYLLTVRAKETGTANTLTITDTTDLDLDEGSNLVSAAEDATLVVDGIDITSSSNKVIGTIPGVTLDLLSETSGTPITVEVAQDSDGVVGAVEDLVSQYNELLDFFNAQGDRDNRGTLYGDPTTRGIQFRIQNLFTGGVEGIPVGTLRSLSSVGVGFDGKTGKASLDSGALRGLLDTHFEEVGNLFLSSGRSTDPRVQYLSSFSETLPGDYAVEITQAAEQATLVGSTAITSLKKNETLTITVGTESVDVALAKNQQIDEIVDTINTALRDADIGATAANDGGLLRISTREWGSAAELTVVSSRADPGNGKQSGFDTTPATDTGVDVAGTIDGEDATGLGQVLAAGDGDASGLSLKITATAADVIATGGDFGAVSYSRGLVDGLIREVDEITKFDSGVIDRARESLKSGIDRLSDDILRLNERIQAREALLLRTFGEAERAISALQSQQASINSFSF